jgi:hypothetical protein
VDAKCSKKRNKLIKLKIVVISECGRRQTKNKKAARSPISGSRKTFK